MIDSMKRYHKRRRVTLKLRVMTPMFPILHPSFKYLQKGGKYVEANRR